MATTGEPFGLFWDSEGGDRTYSAASWEYWLKKFFTSGVFNGDLQVKASSGMTLEIEPGYANVDGKVKFWNGAFTLTLNAANSTYPRIDTIVITRDNVNRQIVCEVVTGSYSGDTPQPTSPVRNSEIYQLVLAQIYVGAGVTGITQANITDTRPDNTLCGWITGTVEELDFSQFTAQFEQYFREFKADAEGDYASWFNEVQSEQIEDKEAWDAWYAALREELHNLPADSAEYLQIQIDELKESGLSGSIFKITTINPSLEGKTVRIINADNTEEKTGTFDSNLECVIYGMKSVGEITITSTDGIQTATSVISIPYFGNYTVPIAFWAATVNMQGDTNLYGATITIKDSDDLTVGTVVLSAVDGTGTFTASKADTYTFNYTYQGISYSQELVVSEETTYSISLSAGFSWQIWVDTASQLDSTDYASLSEVLADEEAVRELFTEHACVDYMAEATSSNADLETIINDDYCAKWINNRDYALDFLGANTVIKALMDEADKYGYGEWALMPQVPTMASDTAPYGTAFASSSASGRAPWNAFDNSGSTTWWASNGSGEAYIGYTFVSPICITRIMMNLGEAQCIKDFRVEASNDNFASDINVIYAGENPNVNAVNNYYDLNNVNKYLSYRIFITSKHGGNLYGGITKLQFYAWAPKGIVPVMTANNAPYGEASGNGIYGSTFDYWKAFAGVNTGESTSWIAPTSSARIYYRFTNPVCAKKVHFENRNFSDPNGRIQSFTVQGSNDGSTWTDLTETITRPSSDNVVGASCDVVLTNSDYYSYYAINALTSFGNYAGLAKLQFYGRELKGLVPSMSSNTSPYGEVSASDTLTTHYPYKVFDGNDIGSNEDFWHSENSLNIHWLQYQFIAPVIIKAFMYRSRNLEGRIPSTIKLQGSNDGNSFTDIVSATPSQTSQDESYQYFSAQSNTTPYEYIRLSMDVTNNTSEKYTDVINLQFYGADYSEKEFEVGTTKKWLYDHGVELEEMTAIVVGANSVATKENDNLYMEVPTNTQRYAAFIAPIIDLSEYSLLRSKFGKIGYSSNSTSMINLTIQNTPNPTYNTSPIANVGISAANGNLPNNLALDISAINQQGYVVVANQNNSESPSKKGTILELWLE